jgi:hypothetical protein
MSNFRSPLNPVIAQRDQFGCFAPKAVIPTTALSRQVHPKCHCTKKGLSPAHLTLAGLLNWIIESAH